MNDAFFGTGSSDEARDIYQASVADLENYSECFSLGVNTTRIMFEDPKLLGFMMARHKFVAKMFDGFDHVLEIGCQEGFGTMVVQQNVKRITAIDFYKPYIESCQARLSNVTHVSFKGADMLDSPIRESFDGAFALDVIEHIDPDSEANFMKNVVASLSSEGVLILGAPSLESQKYASNASKLGHVNCKSGAQFRDFCKQYFRQVFLFSMNDEVLHTGYLPMSQYLFVLCVGPKSQVA